MKRVMFLLACVVVVAILVLAERIYAEGKGGKVDKGPLSKKVFIHYKKPRGKPENPGKPSKPPKDDGGSYTYIANGLKWRGAEDYSFNPGGSSPSFSSDISAAMATWDDQVGFQIFGSLSTSNTAMVNENSDGDNVFVFDNLDNYPWLNIGDSSNVIAVTIVWGYYNGPPQLREIEEVDMIFNTGSAWGWGDATVNPTLMDVQNIAAHEVGHAAGMGDLYRVSAQDETMFGYSSIGETKKRDLYYGDIAGITNLYE